MLVVLPELAADIESLQDLVAHTTWGFTITDVDVPQVASGGMVTTNYFDDVSRVCITTIQRLYSVLKGEEGLDPDLEEPSMDELAGERLVERQRGRGSHLDRREGAVVEVGLDPHQRVHHLGVAHAEAHAPAGHGMALGESVNHDCLVVE